MNELMAWNGLNSSSIVYPDQKLILQVTPPATVTFTPGPPTITPSATQVPPTPTNSPSPTEQSITPTVVELSGASGNLPLIRYVSIGLAAVVIGLVVFFVRKKKVKGEIDPFAGSSADRRESER